MSGRLYVGTSGFAYRGWIPRFYPAGTRASQFLTEYAARLPAVELNNTFYQQPRPERVAAWLAATPGSFRFSVKAQRGGSIRAFGRVGAGTGETIAWLTAPYLSFGTRLGCVLFRVPGNVARDDARLRTLLREWPGSLPLAIEFQHPSWEDDGVHALLRDHGAVLCATDLDEGPPPDLRLTGAFIYLRLRRASYGAPELEAWAARLAPFVADGRDAYVFFRHDSDGQSGLDARALSMQLARLVSASVPTANGRSRPGRRAAR